MPFPGAKTESMFHYLVSLLERMSDYLTLHVGTNNAIDCEASDIVKKILQVKGFIKNLRVPNYKPIISRLIKRQCITCDRRSNSAIPKTNYWYDRKKQLGKRGLYHDDFGLKKFSQNLTAVIRKLWIIEKSFCDNILQKPINNEKGSYIIILEY